MNVQEMWWVVPVGLVLGLWVYRRARQVSPERARQLVDGGAALIDVRTPAEFAAAHLPKAINVPVGSLDANLSKLGPKEQPKVLYCASGMRSAAARARLSQLGFTQVFDLGPMSRW